MGYEYNTDTKLSKQTLLDKPWGPLPDEPSDTYDVFLQYIYLGPKRSLKEAYRKWMVKTNQLLPGQPAPDPPSKFSSAMTNWAWANRARAYDEINWQEEISMVEERRTREVTAMVDRQIEGWQVLQDASIQAFFSRDEDGNIIIDENGPVVERIEDLNLAVRTWRQAVSGERVARGLPSELMTMTNEQIQKRIIEIHTQIDRLESGDIIDGEYE